MSEPARSWIAANQVSEECIFCVPLTIEAKATIRRLALISVSDFDKNAISECGKLY
jgi:hypothetical protein